MAGSCCVVEGQHVFMHYTSTYRQRKLPSSNCTCYAHIHTHTHTYIQRELLCKGCQSTCGILSSASGTFSDGSGPSKYAANANCQWIIAPLGAVNITVTFNQFKTESCCDTVQVFQCQNLECLPSQNVKIAYLAGTNGAAQRFRSSTGYMLVEFTSDSCVGDDGFDASWVSDAPSGVYMHIYTCIYSFRCASSAQDMSTKSMYTQIFVRGKYIFNATYAQCSDSSRVECAIMLIHL
jgi:hypothetical protein